MAVGSFCRGREFLSGLGVFVGFWAKFQIPMCYFVHKVTIKIAYLIEFQRINHKLSNI